MQINGRHCTDALLGRISQLTDRLKNRDIPKTWEILVRCCISISPAFIGSLLFPEISPFFIIGSIIITFAVFKDVQGDLFEFTPKERHWNICIPVSILFLVWASLLYRTGNLAQIGRSIGPATMLVAVAIWPIYMGNKRYEKKKRSIKFETTYIVISVLVLFQQIMISIRGITDA
jgi:hypothetical protein